MLFKVGVTAFVVSVFNHVVFVIFFAFLFLLLEKVCFQSFNLSFFPLLGNRLLFEQQLANANTHTHKEALICCICMRMYVCAYSGMCFLWLNVK